MESVLELEERLIRLDKELHEILHSVKVYKVIDKEAEIQDLRELVNRISSHRILEKDTTMLIREMRDRSYD